MDESLRAKSVVEHGVRFCFVPGGTFTMGSLTGEADERPPHRVTLPEFWISETPLTWEAATRVLGWKPPPHGLPTDGGADREDRFLLGQQRKMRFQYCHGQETWDDKPMIAVTADFAEELCRAGSSATSRWRLPTEAEWERAARGGREGCRYSWGDAPATRDRCDHDNFDAFAVRPSRELPPNDYGLYGMCGGVWEWCADEYDALAYAHGDRLNPCVRARPKLRPKDWSPRRVLRGGSWADAAGACTVSFRMAGKELRCGSPNEGVRVVRVAVAAEEPDQG